MLPPDVPHLIAQAAAADREATELIFREFRPRIQSYIKPLLPPELCPEFDEEDIAQETLFVACLSIHRLTAGLTEGEFFGWLAKISRSLMVDHLRHQRTLKHGPANPRDMPQPQPQSPDDAYTPIHTAQRHEFMMRLTAALSKIPRRSAQVFELFHFQGLFRAEIAESIPLDLANVKKRYKKALPMLRRLLGPGHLFE